MNKELIIFYGMDLGHDDRTVYHAYNDGKIIEISEQEYLELINACNSNTRASERVNG